MVAEAVHLNRRAKDVWSGRERLQRFHKIFIKESVRHLDLDLLTCPAVTVTAFGLDGGTFVCRAMAQQREGTAHSTQHPCSGC